MGKYVRHKNTTLSIENYIFFGIYYVVNKYHILASRLVKMQFATKRELLEHLGKNPDDRKLVDRMVKRGEVYKMDGFYYLVDWFKKRSAWRLYDEIRELREEVNELKKSEPRWTISSAELEEAKIQWKHWEWVARRYWRYCDNIMDICYNKCKMVMWGKFTESRESFKEWIGNMLDRPTE